MRFRGPAIATFLQKAEENLALLGAQLEGPSLSIRASSRHRVANSGSPPPIRTAVESHYGSGRGGDEEVVTSIQLGDEAAAAEQKLTEALGVFAASEREVREQMDIQARTLLGIDRKVKLFDGRLRAAAEEAAQAAAASARLEELFGGSSSSSSSAPAPLGEVISPTASASQGLFADELSELRASVKALDAALAEGRSGAWAAQAVKEQAQQSARDLAAELSRSVKEQLDDFHYQMEIGHKDRLSSLESQLRKQVEEATRDILADFLRGPVLGARIDAIVDTVKSREDVSRPFASSCETMVERLKERAETLEARLGVLQLEVSRLQDRVIPPTDEAAQALPLHRFLDSPRRSVGERELAESSKEHFSHDREVPHEKSLLDQPPVSTALRDTTSMAVSVGSVRERVAALEGSNPSTPRGAAASIGGAPSQAASSSSRIGSVPVTRPSQAPAHVILPKTDAIEAGTDPQSSSAVPTPFGTARDAAVSMQPPAEMEELVEACAELVVETNSRRSSLGIAQDPVAAAASTPIKPRASPSSSPPLESARPLPSVSMFVAECSEDHRSESDDRSSGSIVSANAPSDAVCREGRRAVNESRPFGAVAARQLATENSDEDMEDVEVLLIDEEGVNVGAGGDLALAETEPLVVEDVMEDNKEDGSDNDLPSRGSSMAMPAPSSSLELDLTRTAATAASTMVGGRSLQPDGPTASSDPPSMELWDCLLTQMMSNPNSHGETTANVRSSGSGDRGAVATRRSGASMEVTLAGDCSETSSSSSAVSSPQSRSDLPVGLPLP
mmetsp:Transcript_17772/g.28947  ORF Transcript_17772/g.28947 Transcript_17772/m.28947 type:complete len:789 (-) Transcript_17772:130-2496(-)